MFSDGILLQTVPTSDQSEPLWRFCNQAFSKALEALGAQQLQELKVVKEEKKDMLASMETTPECDGTRDRWIRTLRNDKS